MSASIRVRDLKKVFPVRSGWFGTRRLQAIDGVSFDIPAGTTLGLVGESGCGKTTVGRCLLRLVEPTSGDVWIDQENVTQLNGNDLRRTRRRMQMVFQDPGASLTPRMTIEQLLREPLDTFTGLSESAKRSRVRELMSSVGLSAHFLSRYAHQFSGGQQQRIGIARAIATHPDFIVLDEPTSALDVSVRGQILLLLLQLQHQMGLTYLFISHDLAVIKNISQMVAVMYLGRIVEVGRTEEIFTDPRHPYTRALLAAVPVPDPERAGRDRLKLVGEVPSPINLAPGCGLYARCPFHTDACHAPGPPLYRISSSHGAACTLEQTDQVLNVDSFAERAESSVSSTSTNLQATRNGPLSSEETPVTRTR
jgi:oligopeptide/dipeptide ABC transporter ATP-binding protein